MKTTTIARGSLPLALLRKSSGHKYVHGHALVVSGPFGHSGAARLAARGALRVGAGLVTLAVPRDAALEVAAQITAVMMHAIDDARGLANRLRDDRINALCIGPGLGMTPQTADFVATVLSADRACVLDADALSLLAQQRSLFALLHRKCVLTPHAGEFARLFPDISERMAAEVPLSKPDAAIEAAARAGCVVLLKGVETVVASPEGYAAQHSATGARAAPWLATAGSGDVLAGFIAGLMARGFKPREAAELAVFLHVECALAVGPGLIAEDLPEALPKVYGNLLGMPGAKEPGEESDVPSSMPSA